MRNQLMATACCVAVGLGCGGGTPCQGDCRAAVIVVGADADVLVPAFSEIDIGQSVGYQLFLKLASLGMDLNTVGDDGFAPRLAESWSFDDSLTISFRLNPAARWQDGVPVTAGDVAFTFDVYTDSVAALSEGPLLAPIASVDTVDARTVVFRFKRFYPAQFYDAVYHMYILPRHLLDTVPRGRLRDHPFLRNPVGNGPYRLVRWRPGESIELEADTTFFLGAPWLRRLIWRFTPEGTTALTQLIAGEADVQPSVVGRDDVARARAADGIRVYEYAARVYVYVGFNLRAPGDRSRPHPILSDREVRRAIGFAIDREAIVRYVFGGDLAAIPGQPVTRLSAVWDTTMRQLPFDSARARRILAERGWADSDGDGILDRDGRPLSLELLYPSSSRPRSQTAALVEQQLRAVGVEARLAPFEMNSFVSRGEEGRFEMMVGAWSTDIPPSAVRGIWASSAIGGLNYSRYRSAPFDSLVDAAIAASDPARANGLWHEAFEVINEDAPAVWLFTPRTFLAASDRFENVTIRPDQWAATIPTWRSRER